MHTPISALGPEKVANTSIVEVPSSAPFLFSQDCIPFKPFVFEESSLFIKNMVKIRVIGPMLDVSLKYGSFIQTCQREKVPQEELPSGSSTTTLIEARRRVELHTSRSHNYQFSSHQEDITTRVIQQEVARRDSCSTKYLHQEGCLTTERGLMELKPEQHLKYAQLQDFSRQSQQFSDEMDLIPMRWTDAAGSRQAAKQQDRRNISDEALQVNKLKRENLSLRCKVEKLGGEKEEILKDNKYLKEELNRKKVLISHLLMDIKELHCEKKDLTDIIRCLRWKKQQLCEKFEEKLNRERTLRKDCCRSLMYRDNLLSLVSKEYKKCLVTIWQTSADVEKAEHQMPENELKKEWLQNSIDNLKTKHSKESRKKVQEWLQESLKNLKENSHKVSRHTLPEWLKASVITLEKECPEVSREDVKEWLDTSINCLQKKGPETSPMNVEQWLEESFKSIQDLQKYEAESRGSLRKGWLEKSIENLKKQGSEVPVKNVLQWLEGSLESLSSSKTPEPVLEKWLRDSLKNLEEESPETSNQDAKEWLQMSVNNLEEEGPETSHLNAQEWLKESIKSLQDLQKPKISFQNSLRNGWFEKSLQNMKKQCSEGLAENILQWLQGSLERVSASEEPTPVLTKWLEESLKNLEEESPEEFKQDVKTWLEPSIKNQKNVEEESPEEFKQDVKTWLEPSIKNQKNVEEESPEEFKQDVKTWLELSIKNLEEEKPEELHLGTQGWLQASIKSIQDTKKSKVKFEDSINNGWLGKSTQDLQKQFSQRPLENVLQWLQRSRQSLSSSKSTNLVLENWLQESLTNLEQEDSEEAKDTKKWFEISINNLEPEGPEVPHLNPEEWLETSINGIRDFKKQSFKASKASLRFSRERVIRVESALSERHLRNGWLQASLANSREHGSTASRTGVQAWLQTSLKKIKQESSEEAGSNLEEWLQKSIENIQMGCPEESMPYVKEWLDSTLNHFQEPGPETTHLNVEEWHKISIQGLQEDILKEMTGGKDPKIWRTKVSKGIPSQEKQTLRNKLDKLILCCRYDLF
ncbi:trichohyalin-like [Thamnophis elegans]|uniref:trichohyalin-like n=1 Tax=Thamnophis elegans TaxID=35005 RepID=UPI0013772F18|nr:trichohyalin-like [Thamnophis elegans]